MRLLSLFSGIGAFEKALSNLGVKYELVGFSEIDKYAIQSYCAIHGIDESLNLGDVSKIENEKLPAADLITYGFPCQDISIAGLQKGIKEGTRSGLLYEAERIIEHVKPKYAIAENVKNLVGKKHKNDFEELLKRLEGYGYNNYWKILNAKDFGIPQNRERVFIVSIRKDIDQEIFEFEKPQELKLRLVDLLDKEVEEKYYIENERVSELLQTIEGKELHKLEHDKIKLERIGGLWDTDDRKRTAGEVYDPRRLCPTLNTMQGGSRQPIVKVKELVKRVKVRKHDVNTDELKKEIKKAKEKKGLTNKEIATKLKVEKTTVDHWMGSGDSFSIPSAEIWMEFKEVIGIETNAFDQQIMEYIERDCNYDMNNRVYDEDGLAPTVTTKGDTKVIVREGTKKGYNIAEIGDSINISFPKSKTRRGRVGKEVAQTLDTSCSLATLTEDYRLRKITPLECWRLMGFADEDYWKARRALEKEFYNGNDRSNSQIYKQAGNSICVNVLETIFKELLEV